MRFASAGARLVRRRRRAPGSCARPGARMDSNLNGASHSGSGHGSAHRSDRTSRWRVQPRKGRRQTRSMSRAMRARIPFRACCFGSRIHMLSSTSPVHLEAIRVCRWPRRIRRLRAGTGSCWTELPVHDWRGRGAPSHQPEKSMAVRTDPSICSVMLRLLRAMIDTKENIKQNLDITENLGDQCLNMEINASTPACTLAGV